MAEDPSLNQISFDCEHCQKPVLIGVGLPPTTAPCPHCGYTVTSPDQTETQQEVVATASVVEESPEEVSQAAAKKGKIPILPAAIVVLLALGGVMAWVIVNANKEGDTAVSPSEDMAAVASTEVPAESSPDDPIEILDEGIEPPSVTPAVMSVEDQTAQLLSDFITAGSPEEKMQYVIPNDGVLEGLENYFPIGVSDDDLPISSFVFRGGNDQDRGIYLMSYRRPAEVGVHDYFQAVSHLDAITQKDDSLLDEVSHSSNDDISSQDLSVIAFFKKMEDGLKLDSSVFIQSKFRTLQAFTGYPQPGKSKVFRVALSEMVSHDFHDDDTKRVYRVSDFAYPKEFVSVAVDVDSELGDKLAVLNWRGTQQRVKQRMATVELMWSDDESPVLEMKSLLCWEFLGVGGELEKKDSDTDSESN